MQNSTTLIEKPDDLPGFPAALENLGRLTLILYQALEYGASKTAAYRESECPEDRLDEGLAATLLRFHTKKFLDREGIETQLDDDCTLDWLPFLGMSMHYNGYHVRILKGPGGCLPGCGTSEKKRHFYGQVSTLYLVGTKVHRTCANLLVLWDFDVAYGLSQLWLALPAVGGARAGDVSAFWCEPLPHPSEGSLSGMPPLSPPPSDDLDELIVPLEDNREREQGR